MSQILRFSLLLACLLVATFVNLYSQNTYYNGIYFDIVTCENAISESKASDQLQNDMSTFNLNFIDANTQKPIYKESGIVVSVSFSNVIIGVTAIMEYERVGLFGDTFNETYGLAYLKERGTAQAQNLNYNGDGISYMSVPIVANVGTTIEYRNILSDHHKYTFKRHVQQFDAVINIRAKDYEPRTINLTQISSFYIETIALVQQIQNVNLSGSVNLNNNSNNEQTNNLNILTPKQIADALGLQESEVINLIKSQKIKAKLIAGKYFIRKEDFDEFMKK